MSLNFGTPPPNRFTSREKRYRYALNRCIQTGLGVAPKRRPCSVSNPGPLTRSLVIRPIKCELPKFRGKREPQYSCPHPENFVVVLLNKPN
jgi:hypothetical protein